MLIAVRFARVFRGDDATDFLLDAFARNIFAVAAAQSTLEKELELKKALWCVHIFVGRRAAHGGFVHVNIFGDVAQHHRLEIAYAMVEKLVLKFENALGDPKQSLLALLDAFDQPMRSADFFLKILPRLFFRRALLSGEAAVE